MKKIETTHGSLMVAPFENVLSKAISFSYNEKYIEIPGVVIFSKEGNKTFVNKILNPGIEMITVEVSFFEEMYNAIDAIRAENSVITFKSKTLPEKVTVINLNVLKSSAIFVRVIDNSITVNDIVFTNNEAEFHGDGMFTSKKVYFVNFEQMATIKQLLND